MEELVIHKVAFAAEAVFDYEHCLIERRYPADENDTDWRLDSKHDLPLVILPKAEMKAELEEYIQNHSKHKYKHYFRVRYLDDNFDRELMLFIYRDAKISIMQNWTVKAICFADCWTEDDEEEGRIRSWVETKITNLPNDDWVEEERIRREENEKERLKDEKERKRHERLFA